MPGISDGSVHGQMWNMVSVLSVIHALTADAASSAIISFMPSHIFALKVTAGDRDGTVSGAAGSGGLGSYVDSSSASIMGNVNSVGSTNIPDELNPKHTSSSSTGGGLSRISIPSRRSGKTHKKGPNTPSSALPSTMPQVPLLPPGTADLELTFLMLAAEFGETVVPLERGVRLEQREVVWRRRIKHFEGRMQHQQVCTVIRSICAVFIISVVLL